MLKIISERTPVTVTKRYLEFMIDSCGGLSFELDEHNKPILETDAAKENYEYAMAHPEVYKYCYNEVVKRSWTYTEPAHGICSCGTEIALENQYRGACECPTCGRWYNLFGQALIDPEGWEYDDDNYY